MSDPHLLALRLAARNHGVLTRAQARQAGLVDHQIDFLVETGRWEVLARGVYRITGSPPTPRTSLAAALAATGGLASHRSAAELLSLTDRVPRRPELVVTTNRRAPGSAVVRRVRDLDPVDRTRAGGLPCTSVARTLFDLAAVLPELEHEGLVHKALAGGRVPQDRLVARFRALAGRGRPGAAQVRAVLDRLGPTAAMESHIEVRIIAVLRQYGVRLPEPQVEVTVSGRRYRLDFAYRAEQVFLEGDGYGVHVARDAFETDRTRQNALVLAGWIPLRYTDRALRRTPELVAAEVAAILDARGPCRVE